MATKYVLNSVYITQKVGNKTTVFSGEKSELITFNETAALIFQGLKLGWGQEKIIKKLTGGFDINEQNAKKDIEEFTKTLLDKKILLKKKTE